MEHDFLIDLPVSGDPLGNGVDFCDFHAELSRLDLSFEGFEEVLDQLGHVLTAWLEVQEELVHVDLGVGHLGGDEEEEKTGRAPDTHAKLAEHLELLDVSLHVEDFVFVAAIALLELVLAPVQETFELTDEAL